MRKRERVRGKKTEIADGKWGKRDKRMYSRKINIGSYFNTL